MLDKAQIEKSALYPAFLFLGNGGKLMMQYSMSVNFRIKTILWIRVLVGGQSSGVHFGQYDAVSLWKSF